MRTASHMGIVTLRLEPNTSPRKPPELPQAMGITGHEADRSRRIPGESTEAKQPQPRNGATETNHRTGDAGQEATGHQARDLEMGRAPLVQSNNGPLNSDAQQIRGVTQQENLLQLNTFMTAVKPLDRMTGGFKDRRNFRLGGERDHPTEHPRQPRGKQPKPKEQL